MHECGSFVTLTYNQVHLPLDYSLSPRHAETWLKRLRFVLDPLRIRYFLCGEYGGQHLRPHYHAIIFGFDFPDRTPWRITSSGAPSFRSALLERTWTLGNCEVGTLTPESAGYVAGYSVKKINGEASAEHYRRMNPNTGEIHQVIPEFVRMSSRPGIGRAWYDQHGRDAFPSDFLIVDGQRKAVPRYYKRILDEEKPKLATKVDVARKKRGRERASHPDNHWRRKQDREEFAQHQAARRYPGGLENDD